MKSTFKDLSKGDNLIFLTFTKVKIRFAKKINLVILIFSHLRSVLLINFLHFFLNYMRFIHIKVREAKFRKIPEI